MRRVASREPSSAARQDTMLDITACWALRPAVLSDATKRTSVRAWKTRIIVAAEAARTTAALRTSSACKALHLSDKKAPARGLFYASVRRGVPVSFDCE